MPLRLPTFWVSILHCNCLPISQVVVFVFYYATVFSVTNKATSCKFIQDVFHASQRYINLLFYLSIRLLYIVCILQQIKHDFQSCILKHRIGFHLRLCIFPSFIKYLENQVSCLCISDKAVSCTVQIVDTSVCQFC